MEKMHKPMKTITLSILFIITTLGLNAQGDSLPTVLTIDAKHYVGEEIVFKTPVDPLTDSQRVVFSGIVGQDGAFTDTIMLDETIRLSADLGKIMGYVFMVPGKNYTIHFPKLAKKTLEDELNPFFSPEEFYFYVNQHKDTNDINYLVKDFNYYYDELTTEHYTTLFVRPMPAVLEKVVNQLDSIFRGRGDAFFQEYLAAKLAGLRHITNKQSWKAAQINFFNGHPSQLNNPAYVELFNSSFDQFLMNFTQVDEKGTALLEKLNVENHPIQARDYLLTKPYFSDTLFTELVVLKSVYDAVRNNYFSYQVGNACLDTFQVYSHYTLVRETAKRIQGELKHLRKGTLAPEIELQDLDGNQIEMDDRDRRFTLLAFSHSQSYTCQAETEALEIMRKRFPDHLRVISVFGNEKNKDILAFRDRFDVQWEMAISPDGEAFDTYLISVYPTYYLIDPDGYLVMSPAPGPNEKFDKAFISVLRAYGREY